MPSKLNNKDVLIHQDTNDFLFIKENVNSFTPKFGILFILLYVSTLFSKTHAQSLDISFNQFNSLDPQYNNLNQHNQFANTSDNLYPFFSKKDKGERTHYSCLDWLSPPRVEEKFYYKFINAVNLQIKTIEDNNNFQCEYEINGFPGYFIYRLTDDNNQTHYTISFINQTNELGSGANGLVYKTCMLVKKNNKWDVAEEKRVIKLLLFDVEQEIRERMDQLAHSSSSEVIMQFSSKEELIQSIKNEVTGKTDTFWINQLGRGSLGNCAQINPELQLFDMPFVSGKTLLNCDYLLGEPFTKKLQAAIDLLQQLSIFHDQFNAVHNDLHSGNVMYDSDTSTVTIIDLTLTPYVAPHDSNTDLKRLDISDLLELLDQIFYEPESSNEVIKTIQEFIYPLISDTTPITASECLEFFQNIMDELNSAPRLN